MIKELLVYKMDVSSEQEADIFTAKETEVEIGHTKFEEKELVRKP